MRTDPKCWLCGSVVVPKEIRYQPLICSNTDCITLYATMKANSPAFIPKTFNSADDFEDYCKGE